jgi:hypothetical protein
MATGLMVITATATGLSIIATRTRNKGRLAEADRPTCLSEAGGYRLNARINGNTKSSSIKNAIKLKQSQPIPTSKKPTARIGEWGEYRIFSPVW